MAGKPKKTDPEFPSAAALVKQRIREGKAKAEIEEETQRMFPDYRAWKIAVGVYRRELRAKGEIPGKED